MNVDRNNKAEKSIKKRFKKRNLSARPRESSSNSKILSKNQTLVDLQADQPMSNQKNKYIISPQKDFLHSNENIKNH